MTENTRVLLDTDPGVDDALAFLFAAASPELDLVGVTTVIGNTPAPRGARNALALLELVGKTDVPVAVGADRPILHPRRDYIAAPSKVHGESGLGSLQLPEPKRGVEPFHAVQLMVEQIRKYEGKLTIVAVGPLTNVALLATMYPEEIARVERVIVMGGSQAEAGNYTSAAEYNFWVDPIAAQTTVQYAPNLHLLTLDATHQAALRLDDVEALRRGTSPTAVAAAELLDFYVKWHRETYGDVWLPMHDSLAIVALTNPELISWAPARVRVGYDESFLRGVSIVDRHAFDGPHNASVGVSVDEPAFRRLFVERLGGVE